MRGLLYVTAGGMFVSVLSDVDGGGVPHIFASDWRGGAKRRRAHFYDGKTGRPLRTYTDFTPAASFSFRAA